MKKIFTKITSWASKNVNPNLGVIKRQYSTNYQNKGKSTENSFLNVYIIKEF